MTEKPIRAPMAFGVDDKRKEYYSLRQSRYEALATDIDNLAKDFKQQGRRLRVVDIGCRANIFYRYISARPHFHNINFFGGDIEDIPAESKSLYEEFYLFDLMEPNPPIPKSAFDVVVNEQVLEHLDSLEVAVNTLSSLVAPGGKLFVGVPIFPFGLHLVRRHLVPVFDKIVGTKKIRGHVQAFSQETFLKVMAQEPSLKLQFTRGFRIISGGILRPLENYRWWWRFNRRLGAAVPWLCIEIQAVFIKEKPDNNH